MFALVTLTKMLVYTLYKMGQSLYSVKVHWIVLQPALFAQKSYLYVVVVLWKACADVQPADPSFNIITKYNAYNDTIIVIFPQFFCSYRSCICLQYSNLRRVVVIVISPLYLISYWLNCWLQHTSCVATHSVNPIRTTIQFVCYDKHLKFLSFAGFQLVSTTCVLSFTHWPHRNSIIRFRYGWGCLVQAMLLRTFPSDGISRMACAFAVTYSAPHGRGKALYGSGSGCG